MKSILSLFLFCLSTITYGQEKLKLELNNPQPRVGQTVELSFDMSALNDYIDKQLNPSGDFEIVNSYFTKNDFKRSLSFEKPGIYTIGAITFSLNGIRYEAEAIEIEVIEELSPQEGIWVRHVKTANGQFLLIEQMLSNESDLKTSGNSMSYSVGGVLQEEDQFAELKDQKYDNVSFTFRGSNTRTVSIDSAMPGSAGYTYSLKKYSIQIEEDFSGKFKLSKKHFKNLPSGVKIPKLTITNE